MNLVEGDSKASFSTDTALTGRRGCYSFPVLLHFTLDLYLINLCVKQGGMKNDLWSLWYDSIWAGTPVTWTNGEQSTHLAKRPV